MAVFDLFSKRQRRARGEVPDLYSYDALPEPLRVQIVHIITDAIGEDRPGSNTQANDVYETAHKILCREHGVFTLTSKNPRSQKADLISFFLTSDSVEKALDVVEVCFKMINGYVRKEYRYTSSPQTAMAPDDAIKELNARFKEHGIGYQFESNELLRIDSDLIHAEAVKPALAILRNKAFSGANDEFLSAYEHYRHGRHKECLVDALKAFESTMKVICIKRKWTYQPTDTAKSLISVCFKNELVPSYLESHFTSLRSLLESGVPTIRNKAGGHGQGDTIQTVPAHLASYALHLTASSIVFLVQAHTEKR